MKTLLLLRHAKSSWKDETLDDHDRPLKARGERDAPRMGQLLREQDLLPDVVLCSTARRARQTADLALEAGGYDGEVQYLRDLYFSGPEAYLQALAALPDEVERVLVIGHNPDIEELVDDLSGGFERMPTAALAQIVLTIDDWQDVLHDPDGRLVNLWTPRGLVG